MGQTPHRKGARGELTLLGKRARSRVWKRRSRLGAIENLLKSLAGLADPNCPWECANDGSGNIDAEGIQHCSCRTTSGKECCEAVNRAMRGLPSPPGGAGWHAWMARVAANSTGRYSVTLDSRVSRVIAGAALRAARLRGAEERHAVSRCESAEHASWMDCPPSGLRSRSLRAAAWGLPARSGCEPSRALASLGWSDRQHWFANPYVCAFLLWQLATSRQYGWAATSRHRCTASSRALDVLQTPDKRRTRLERLARVQCSDLQFSSPSKCGR